MDRQALPLCEQVQNKPLSYVNRNTCADRFEYKYQYLCSRVYGYTAIYCVEEFRWDSVMVGVFATMYFVYLVPVPLNEELHETIFSI